MGIKKLLTNLIVSIGLLSTLLFSACGMPGDPMYDDAWTKNLYPGINGTYSIGSPDYYYLDIRATTGYFDQIIWGAGTRAERTGPVDYGEIYIATTNGTTITTPGTYYKLEGITIPHDEMGLYQSDNMVLTYNGTYARTFYISATISATSDTNNVVIDLMFDINGTCDPRSRITRKLAVADDEGAMSIITICELSPSDTVSIMITADKASVITAITTTLTVHSIS